LTLPVITVVIPSYNRVNYICKAIESVKIQSYPAWKILIIDDASTDQTLKTIQPYFSDPRIQLIALPENKGISRVLNHALNEVDTDYFLQLDSDDWLEKTALARIAEAISEKPNAALYYGNVRMWEEREHGIYRKARVIHHRSFSTKYQFLSYMTYMLHPRCYRTAAVRAVGGWETDDPFEGRMMEDRRMCVKLIERYPFYWINQILYNRRKHRDQLTNRKSIQMRNQLRRQLVLRSLKKWGNHFEPEFGYRNGFLIVKKFIPKNGG
jgi:glycosyltransferase involved in cell wall biosynthesis